jgi:hypothetical protein
MRKAGTITFLSIPVIRNIYVDRLREMKLIRMRRTRPVARQRRKTRVERQKMTEKQNIKRLERNIKRLRGGRIRRSRQSRSQRSTAETNLKDPQDPRHPPKGFINWARRNSKGRISQRVTPVVGVNLNSPQDQRPLQRNSNGLRSRVMKRQSKRS